MEQLIVVMLVNGFVAGLLYAALVGAGPLIWRKLRRLRDYDLSDWETATYDWDASKGERKGE